MKKFLTSIVVFFTAFLLTACGLIMPQSSSQGGGGGHNGGSSSGTVIQEPFDCVMEQEGILEFRNYENGEIIVVVDGKEHKVNAPTLDLYSLNLSNGRYMAIVNFYINGENQYQNYFEFFIGKEEIKGNRIVFYDYNGMLIKEIFLPYGELFTQEIFPEVNDKPGVTYSWDYDVKLGSELNQDLEIKQIASFTEYKVTYHLNGGKFEYEVEAKYTIENPYFMLQDPVKDGFMFDGWYENSSFNGNPISQFNTSIAKDIEVYAKWIELTAEVREIITIFEDCIQEDLVTIKGSNGESTYELALDLSGDSVYYHYKQDGKLSEVVMNNMTYHYHDMTYTTNKADKDNYKDPLSLKHLGNMIISTTKEEKNGTITYKAKVKNDDASVTIVVKNGKLASITTQQDRYKEEYNFSYNVSKEKVDVSKFTQKLEVRIFEVLVSEEGEKRN